MKGIFMTQSKPLSMLQFEFPLLSISDLCDSILATNCHPDNVIQCKYKNK